MKDLQDNIENKDSRALRDKDVYYIGWLSYPKYAQHWMNMEMILLDKGRLWRAMFWTAEGDTS